MFKLIFNMLGNGLLKSVFAAWVGVLRGGLSMALNMFKSTLSAAFSSVKSFNQMGVNTSRAIGLGYKESIAYTQTLITRTQRLSALYGVTADKIAAIQDSLAKATGKAIMLSNAQAEYATAINKMLGDGALDEYSKAVIRSMGGSVDAAQKAAIGAYTKASRVGLSAAEFSSKVAQNLSMANRVTFRGGVDGITKMTALAERLNFNLQSMEASADVFRNDIQTAIESSARLQALGGGAALYGSNPLAMMYESMYDMESYTERITKMVNGMAVFDAAKGVAEISAYNKEFLRHYSEILKIPYDELASMATNQAKEAFAKTRLGGAFFDNLAEGDEEFKSFIMNKAQWNDKNQTFELTLPGQEDNPIDLRNMSVEQTKELKKAWKDSTLTETEAFLQGARDITSIDERISGIMSVVGAMLAEKLMPYLTVASMWLSKAAPKIASVLGRALGLLITPGFWKNIGIDFASLLIGGIAMIAQFAVMRLLGPWGFLLKIVGAIAHFVGAITGWDWVETVGKVLDGTGIAQLAMKTAGSWLGQFKDTNALQQQNGVLTDASALVRQAGSVFGVAHNYANAVERGEQYDYVDALQRVTGENYGGSGNYAPVQTPQAAPRRGATAAASARPTTTTNTQTSYATTTNTQGGNVTINNNRNVTQTVNNNTTTNNNRNYAYSSASARGGFQNVEEAQNNHRFQVTALSVVEDIRRNTRDAARGIDDIQRDNEDMAQAQLDAMDELRGSPAYAAAGPGADILDPNLLQMPEEEMASMNMGEGGGIMGELASTLFSIWMAKSLFRGGGFGGKAGKGLFSRLGRTRFGRAFGDAKAYVQLWTGDKVRAARTAMGNGFRNNMATLRSYNGAAWGEAYRNSRLSYSFGRNVGGMGRTRAFLGAGKQFLTQGARASNLLSIGKVVGKGLGIGAIASGAGMLVDNFWTSKIDPSKYGSAEHYGANALSSALEWGGMGATVGSIFGPWGTAIGGALGGLGGAIKGLFNAHAEEKKEKERQAAIAEYNQERNQFGQAMSQRGLGFENTTYHATSFKDAVIGTLSTPEAASVNGMNGGTAGGEVVAAPVGGPEYVYSPSAAQTVQSNTPQTIKVSDITVKVNGTLRIDGGNGNTAQLDMNKLLENREFVRKLTEVIFDEKNIQANNSRSTRTPIWDRGGIGSNAFTANIT